MCFLDVFAAVQGRLPNMTVICLALVFLICLNFSCQYYNRTRFQWWLLRVEFRKYSSITACGKKYSYSLSIWYELDGLSFCLAFPCSLSFLLFRQMQFSCCNSFSDLDLLFPLYLCQLKHTSGCAYDIFSEIHCVRDVTVSRTVFPLSSALIVLQSCSFSSMKPAYLTIFAKIFHTFGLS